MFLAQYFCEENQKIVISREQASRFAKHVADDFNPIHDVDAKRFCVPGDLLFSILLAKTGVSQSMSVQFSGMVTEQSKLTLPKAEDAIGFVTDDNQKSLLEVTRAGNVSTNEKLIESLVRAYVSFSGHCFPHVFVKLMKKEGVMINPSRPMVMYEKMAIEFASLDFNEVSVACKNATLSVDGKRGSAKFEFDFTSGGRNVGHGVKHMVLSGLKPYDESEMLGLVTYYNGLKQDYIAA